MINFISRLPFAYLIYRFYFSGFSQNIQQLVVYSGVLLYISLNYRKVLGSSGKQMVYFFNRIILLMALFGLAILWPVMKSTLDFAYARKIVSFFGELFCWIAFAVYVKKKAGDGDVKKTLTDEFCMITLMYIAFSAVCMLFPNFRAFWCRIVPILEADMENLEYNKYAGRLGWDGFAGFDSTFFCTFGVFLCVSYLSEQNTKLLPEAHGKSGAVSQLRYYFMIAGLLAGNFIYGRTGLVVSAVLLLGFVLYEGIVKKKIHVLCYTMGPLAVIFIMVLILKEFIPKVDEIYNWAFEPLINLLHGKGFTATSLDSLTEMYQIRIAPSTFFTGDGRYVDCGTLGAYYKDVDVGYIRSVLFWGVFPTVLAYLGVFLCIRRSVFHSWFSTILLMTVLLLFELKGEVWRNLYVMTCALILIAPDCGDDRLKTAYELENNRKTQGESQSAE